MTLTDVGTAMTTVLGWVGDVIASMTTAEGDLAALAPFFLVTVAVSAILLGIKVIRGFVWGA